MWWKAYRYLHLAKMSHKHTKFQANCVLPGIINVLQSVDDFIFKRLRSENSVIRNKIFELTSAIFMGSFAFKKLISKVIVFDT